MRVVHTRRPLRRDWCGHPRARGLVAEADIKASRRARLRAKLLVFDSPKHMDAFWRDALGRPLTYAKWGAKRALGAVNALSVEIRDIGRDGSESCRMEVDPRYFCVIGLVRSSLSMETVAHEAVHAGFAYAKRRGGDMWKRHHEFDEEHIAYPAGAIAAAINRFLYAQKLYPQ